MSFLYDDDVDAQAVANGIKNYRTAWNNFRKVRGTSIPTFHRKSYAGSYQTNPHYRKDATRIDQCNVYLDVKKKHVQLPKLGSVHFKDGGMLAKMFARNCRTRIGSITVSQDACGDYYASFQVASEQPFRSNLPKTGKSVGIDMNVKNFFTDSEGCVIDNPAYLHREEIRLAKEQRKLSRRMERAKKEKRPLSTSKNYQEQRLKVAKIHRAIERRRKSFQHQESIKLTKNHDLIVAEDLKVKNLLRNHCLAKSISDCAWGEFFRMLSYKSLLYGRHFQQVKPHYTTQTCSNCGYRITGPESLGLDVRTWTCPSCGSYHDRDHNSAQNILRLGLLSES